MRTAYKELTDAQIKALPTTPVTIISGLGAGKSILFLGAKITAILSGGFYTNLNAAGYLYLADDFNNQISNVTQLARFADVNNKLLNITPVAYPGSGSYAGFSTDDNQLLTQADNSGLVIRMSNGGSGALTGGNAANKLKVFVFYEVLDLTPYGS